MANAYTKLFINNLEVDLLDSEQLPVALTRRINSIDGDIQGDYSRETITIPATKKNVQILGKSTSVKPFRIEIDGMPSINGTAKIKSGKNYSQGYGLLTENYQILLISNNSTWFTLLRETMLSELTTLLITYNETDIREGFKSITHTYREYAMAFIKWHEWANFNGTYYTPSLYEATPMLYLKPLIVAAFNSIGYTVNSDFLDTNTGKKLVMDVRLPEKMPQAYNDDYLNLRVRTSAPYAVVDGVFVMALDTLDYVPVYNPLAFDVVTHQYTVPQDGYYEFTLSVRFDTAEPIPYFPFLENMLFGLAPIPPGAYILALVDPTPYITSGKPVIGSMILKLTAGDVLDVTLIATLTANYIIDEIILTIKGESTQKKDVPIDFRYLLTEYSFIEMLKGLSTMFNLCFETNEDTKTVTIEPKDAYLDKDREAGTSLLKEGFYKFTSNDIRDKLDLENPITFDFPDMPSRFDYKFQTDNDDTIDYIELGTEIGIYESRFPIANGFGGRAETVEVPFFAKTIHVFDTETKPSTLTATPQFPLIYPENYLLNPTIKVNTDKYKPRIFYFGGIRAGVNFTETDGFIELFEDPAVFNRNPICFMVNYTDNTGLDPNLGFGDVEINGILTKGLMSTYHLQELARNDRSEVLNAYIRFNSIDNSNFTFRLKALVDSQQYIYQEIQSFNPILSDSTLFKFYLDVYPLQSDIDNIQNSTLIGTVSLLIIT